MWLSVLGLHREYSLSFHLVIEWEAAGNISKCKLTFNYTKISFRDHFSCQADSDLLECFPFFVGSQFSSSYWEQLEMSLKPWLSSLVTSTWQNLQVTLLFEKLYFLLRHIWIPDIHTDILKMWIFLSIYIKNRAFLKMSCKKFKWRLWLKVDGNGPFSFS